MKMKSFGVTIRQAERLPGHAVPSVVERILDHLQAHALDTEGLFRVPGEWVAVNKLKKELDEDPEGVDLNKYDYNSIAEVLKKYFAELPEPLVPPLIDQHVKALFVGERKGREEIMREIKFAVDSLSEESYSLLERLTEFMAVLVSFANRNKMNLASIYDEYLYLAACIAPTLKFTPAIFTYCIQYHSYFFNPPDLQIPSELTDLAMGVEKTSDKMLPRKDTPNVSIPLRQMALITDPAWLNRDSSNGSVSTTTTTTTTATTRDEMGSPPGTPGTPGSSPSWTKDTPRGDPFPREGSFALQERERERERDRDRDRDRERERERERDRDQREQRDQREKERDQRERERERDREREREKERDRERERERDRNGRQRERAEESKEEQKESELSRHSRRKSRRGSPNHRYSSEDLSGQEGLEYRGRHRGDSRYDSATSLELGKSKSTGSVNSNGSGDIERDKEREQKKRYYKEELSKLQKISDYYKMEALNSKAKIEELTDKNFDLDGQLKKQKLKNKELLLERKLKRNGIEVTRIESKEEEKREEREKDKRVGDTKPASPSPMPINKISPRRRRSVSIGIMTNNNSNIQNPNDIQTINATGVVIDFERAKRKEKRSSMMSVSDTSLNEHRSKSTPHIEAEMKRNEYRKSMYAAISKRDIEKTL